MIESYEKINTTNENQLGEVQCWVNLGFFPIWGFYSEFSARGSKTRQSLSHQGVGYRYLVVPIYRNPIL